MIRDARELDTGTTLEADLAIAGAGAAGIALALEFIGRGFSVCLLEGGGEERQGSSQGPYRGTCEPPLEDSYLMQSRLRFLGGTTNHWVGACLPLDRIEFEERPWVPESGWPFGRDELDPFYERAARLLGIEPPIADVAMGRGFEKVRRKRFQMKPVRFGAEFRGELDRAGNLELYLRANVVDVVLVEGGSAISHFEVATTENRRFRVRARHYVLALGGIENARLLLTSDGVEPAGVGNRHDLVGRYFMDHPVFAPGQICVAGGGDLTLTRRQIWDHHLYRLSDETLREHQLLGCGIGVHLVPQVEDTRLSSLERSGREQLGAYLETRDGAPPAPIFSWSEKGELYLRDFYMRPEPLPDAESRVRLGEEHDGFGNRRAHLRWRVGEEVLDTVRRTARIFSEEIARAGLGRVRFAEDALDFNPGYHHMGATRMHDDAKRGVVDRQARVHGIDNLYIAGSSVFPASGFANPTYTLLALTLRLADHLRGRLAR